MSRRGRGQGYGVRAVLARMAEALWALMHINEIGGMTIPRQLA